jgi:formylglycine-generating enzyme required for sulfatase activity
MKKRLILVGAITIIVGVGATASADGETKLLPPSAELWNLPPGAPQPAIAPFDASKAKELQEAWAKYLKVPVETTNAIGMKLVLIPPGEFTMSEGEQAHRVRITKAFYMGKYMVTQEEWEAVMGSNPSQFKGPKNPVDKVSWTECKEFLDKLSQKCGTALGSYLLPTEAQWEHAGRVGSHTKWYFGDDETLLGEHAWYKENAERKTHPVGEKKANAWGVHDVYGNVWVWCSDWFDKDYYKNSPLSDPAGPDAPLPSSDPDGPRRAHRGGDCNDRAEWCRSAPRGGKGVSYRASVLGFRACQILPDK